MLSGRPLPHSEGVDPKLMSKVRWGVLGVAKIATEKVIPAMSSGECSQVVAIASRDPRKAEAAAKALGLPKAYGSYRELLADPDIDAIYNPLPNHLHKEWTIAAAESGKHVLCEKPIALTAEEAQRLIEVRERIGVLIQEAAIQPADPFEWARDRCPDVHVRRHPCVGRQAQAEARWHHADDVDRTTVQANLGSHDRGVRPE